MTDTLATALAAACERWRERPALTYRGRSWTYAEVAAAVAALAERYRRLGVGPGDRVVCQVSNRPELVVALGAAWMSGAIHVGVDWQLTVPELTYLVDHTGAAALVHEPPDASPERARELDRMLADRPDLPAIEVWETVGPDGLAFDPSPSMGFGEAAAGVRPQPGDAAAIFVTSGTTGRPKTAVGYHANLCQRWRWLAGELRFSPVDVHLTYLPLSHGFGLMMAAGGLLTGGRLVLLDRFSAAEALRLAGAERVTVLHGSPTHFRLLLDRLKPPLRGSQGGTDLSTLRIGVGSAASFPPSLLRGIFDELGMDFMLMYGSSEGVGVVTTDREDMLLGAVGRPEPGSVAILAPGGGGPLPAGEAGEIAFSRRRYPVRYWFGPGDRAAHPAGPLASAGDAAWYRSGDLGRLDEAGRLYVLGKLKHQVSRGGLHVDPVEVELALLECPDVADAAVIALPNPVLGEVVCACVVPTAGAAPTLEGLRAALAGRLAPHKQPDELRVLERIPRSRIGKVDLPALRALAGTPAAEPAERR